MNRWLGWVIVSVLGLGVAQGWARSDVSQAERVELLTPVTLGIRSQESETEGVADVLVPLWRGPQSVLLANLRGAMNDHDEEELNVGLGLRHLVDARHPFIVGGFVFYDGRWTRQHNRFDQLGLSAEVLSDWVDGRINYYLPNHGTALVDREDTLSTRETRRVVEESATAWGDPYGRVHEIVQDRTTVWTRREITTRETIGQFYENREAALEGWDAEIGLRLPLFERWFETRVFAGYQYFDHPFGGHLKGAQGRIELRALEGRLLLDAQVFENRELNQSDWRAGVRMRLPFELSALAQGRNPFARTEAFGRGDLRSRLDDMVMRDPKIQLQKSGYVEDVSKRTTEKSTRTKEEKRTENATEVLADGVTFVDGDQGDDANPGTAEQPKETIQGGVDGAQASSRLYTMAWPDGKERRLVYVRSASQPYAGAEVESPDIGLFGSSVPMPAFDGKVFGGGASPRVLSENAPGLVVLDSARGLGITGFEFTGSGLSTGIRSRSGELLVWNNDFRQLTYGLAMETSDPDVDSWFLANRFSEITERGIDVDAQGDGTGLFRLRAEDNSFRDGQAGLVGESIIDYDAAHVLFARNNFRDLEGGGLLFMATLADDSTGTAQIALVNNVVYRSGMDLDQGIGLGVIANSRDGHAIVHALGNRVDEAATGLYATGLAHGNGHAQVILSDNLVSNCYLAGIFSGARAFGTGNAEVVATENLTRETSNWGFFLIAQAEEGSAYVGTAENIAEGAGTGMAFGVTSSKGFAALGVNGDTVRDNTFSGIDAEVSSAEGHATMLFLGVTAENNGGDGIYADIWSDAQSVTVDFANNELKNNAEYGLNLQAKTEGEALNVFAVENRAEGNEEVGMSFMMESASGDIQFFGMDNAVVDNGDSGLDIYARNTDGTSAANMNVLVADNIAVGNQGDGVFVVALAESSGMVGLNVTDNLMDENQDGGLRMVTYLSEASGNTLVSGNRFCGNAATGFTHNGMEGSDVVWTVASNVIEDNLDGVDVFWDVNPVTADFTFTANSLENTQANFWLEAPFAVNAQGNWWGAAPPDPAKIVATGAGAIDWSNWLPVRPDLP
ncbi:MAG: hypothetical protein GX803_00505 [Lentisphaerae bacterium]|jgi:hypothetical protein|nr:hypothetical protein [Lentisphaerota bacterium]